LSTRQINSLKQDTNSSLYWKCQLIGWTLAAAYWAFIAYTGGKFDVGLGIGFFVFDIVIGIGVTHAYHQFAHVRGWIRLDLPQLPWRIIPAIIITGIAYMILIVIKNYYVRAYFGYHFEKSLVDSFKQNYMIITATGIRLMAIWILAFHLYHYAVLQINTTRENARLSVIAKEAQLNNLSAQLNPHFFFNSLNSIKSLVATEPEKARRAIDLLSDLLRNSLYEKDTLLIPLSDEIGLVNDYLELEKIRFEDRLMYMIDIDEGLEGCLLLPLSIQTLAENAIKHGISKRTDGGRVSIKVEKEAANIRITVNNPGRIEKTDKSGLGLKNLSERLTLQYNKRASLELTQLPGDMVSAIMIIPSS